jgi:hypothetical protein
MDFSKITNKYNETIQELNKEMLSALKEGFKEFWELNPKIKAVVWQQYTPYFMDGDPCEFSVNEVSFTNAEDEEDLKQISWGEYYGNNPDVICFNKSEFSMGRKSKVAGACDNSDSVIHLSNFITSSAAEEMLKSTFGDHKLVIATREGFTTYEFEHE